MKKYFLSFVVFFMGLGMAQGVSLVPEPCVTIIKTRAKLRSAEAQEMILKELKSEYYEGISEEWANIEDEFFAAAKMNLITRTVDDKTGLTTLMQVKVDFNYNNRFVFKGKVTLKKSLFVDRNGEIKERWTVRDSHPNFVLRGITSSTEDVFAKVADILYEEGPGQWIECSSTKCKVDGRKMAQVLKKDEAEFVKDNEITRESEIMIEMERRDRDNMKDIIASALENYLNGFDDADPLTLLEDLVDKGKIQAVIRMSHEPDDEHGSSILIIYTKDGYRFVADMGHDWT